MPRLTRELANTLCRESTAPGCKLQCRGGLMAEEAVALLKDFYATGNPKGPSSAPVPEVPQSCVETRVVEGFGHPVWISMS